MNKLIIASAACAAGLSLFAGVPAGNLPLPKDGLAVHLDASDTSTMMLDDQNRVTEWRSKVGAVKFVQGESQAAENLPYYQSTISYPAAADVPGVVFGLETGYSDYKNAETDKEHVRMSYLTSDTEIDSKEVFLVMVSLNVSAKNMSAYDGRFFCTGVRAEDSLMYAGNMWGGNTVYSYSGNGGTWYYNGTDGKAWVDGVLVYDYPTVYGICGSVGGWNSPSYQGFGSKVSVIDAIGGTVREHVGKPSLGYNGVACGTSVICEAVIYDKVLSDEERAYVQKALFDKWRNKSGCVAWTGAGDAETWSDPANWSGAAVPTAADTVVVDGAAVTIDADAACATLSAPDATLTVADGVTFQPQSFLGPNAGLTLTGTGTLRFAPCATTALPPLMSVTGGLTAWLGGTATAMDLRGGDQAFASVLGGGAVVNTAEAVATLTLAGAADGALEAKIGENVNVRKTGAETTLSVSGWQDYPGDTILDGGTVEAVTNLVVDAIPGLVLHLDAQRSDTIERDADGLVSRWYLTNDPTNFFALAKTGEFMGATYLAEQTPPLYLATGINDTLPCVRFGNNSTRTPMKLGETKGEDLFTLKHRTAIVVHVPQITGNDTVVPYGRYYLASPGGRYHALIKYWSNSNVAYGHSVWGGGTNEVYINSKKSYDFLNGPTPENIKFGYSVPPESLYPQILTVTIPEADPEPPVLTYRPVLGAYCYRSYNDGGSYECKGYIGNVCEVMVFDRYLPDAERRMIETYLYHKWFTAAFGSKVYPPYRGERAFTNTLASSTFVVTADTTFAPIGSQAIAALTVDAQGAETAPCLTLTGDLDLSQTAFILTNGEAAVKGPVVQTTGTLSGEFKSVEGVDAYHKLVYRAKDVIYKAIRGAMLLVR